MLAHAVGAQLVINELMTKNVSFVMDESKNYSMWVEVYNKGTTAENLCDYCFTDNPEDRCKWRPQSRPVPAGGFAVLWFERPDFNGHANFKLEPEDGALYLTNNGEIVDEVHYSAQYRNISFGRTVDGAGSWTYFTSPSIYRGEAITDPVTAINNDDTWNYWYKTIPPAANWNLPTFDDSDWEQNQPAPLGYGKSGINTGLGHYPAAQTGYFRKKIHISDISQIYACHIESAIDDAAAYYVNGTEVYRFNLTSGELTYSTPAITAYGDPTVLAFDIPANLLLEGENTVAVEVHQSASLSSSDYYFSLNLTYNDPQGTMQNPFSNTGKTSPESVCTEPKFATAAGFYPSGTVSVKFEQPDSAGYIIRYTTDGSEPTEISQKYEANNPIILTATTCLRAATFAENRITSNIATATYFIGERNFNLPVVSFATDPKNFFDSQIGIYTDGVGGKKNYEQDWDRPVNFELFDTKGKTCLNQELDVSIAGAYSKQYPLKSLKISPKHKFGSNRLKYSIFTSKKDKKFKDIQIRNSGNDFEYTMFRDGFMQTLIIDRLNVDYQAYEPAICFINGVYYGIENLRERTNKDYLYTNYGLEEGEFILIESGNKDDCREYTDFISYLQNSNTASQTVYSRVDSLLDINSYIDYIIAQTYYSNYDWPDNNYKMWRPVESGGKWRWLLYDLDFGFDLQFDSRPGGYYENTVQYLFNSGESIIIPLRRLILNDEFKKKYINRFCIHLSTTFATSRVDAIMDSLAARIENEMPYHKMRWGAGRDFYNEISIMKTFSLNRPNYLMSYLSDYFFVSKPIINVALSSNTDNVNFVFNSEPVPENPAVIKYFKDNQVKITATSAEGKTFSHWELQSSNGIQAITSAEFSTVLSENIQLKAIFDSTNGIENILPNNAKTVKSIDYFDVLGRKLPKNAKGIVIKKIIYEDNTSSTEKTFLK
jgi:hypothetical protein